MKLSTYTNVNPMFNRTPPKTGDKEGGGSNGFERQQKQKKEDQQEFEASLEAVEAAVEDFGADEDLRLSGFSATTEGNGPGLKVVLKDGTGGILRSISGEEFLKLKDAVNSGARSGRLLDQKA